MRSNPSAFIVFKTGLFILALFLISSCREKNFQKSLVGKWDVKTMSEDSVNLLDYYRIDSLITDTCALYGELHLITNWVIEFKKKKALEITEHRVHAVFDTLSSLRHCTPRFVTVDTTIVYKGTWETAGVGNLALIYNNTVDNLRIVERTDNDMVWEKDLNVTGGLVSFSGIRKYTVKRR